MITYIIGVVNFIDKEKIILENNGIGYMINCINKYENLQLFKDLMNIKGIGCKFSFYISSNNVNAVKMAIKNKDIEYLSSIPHIGEKMALKIISAYKPKKIDNIDLIETLLTLGYLKKDIYEILDKIDPNDNLNEQIKQSLKLLSERK